jgi:hypothetical protein
MTTVGKILVFLNLVFSFVVGFFAVMDYTARTHWATKFGELSKKYQVEQATTQTYRSEADRLTRERDALNRQLMTLGKKELGLKDMKTPEEVDKETERAARAAVKVLEDRSRQIDQLNARLVAVTKERDSLKSTLEGYKASTTTSLTASQRRDDDVVALRRTLKLETEKNNDLVREMNDLRDRTVAAEISAKSYKDRNTGLEEQLQDLARDLTRLRGSRGAPATGVARRTSNPPPDDVEGLVRRAEGRLVTITIGSDAGLAKGQTLEVFRFGNTPRYIGRIKIVDVTPTQAVGEVVGKLTAAIREGDTVASNIMGRR